MTHTKWEPKPPAVTAKRPPLNPALKLALDLGPLLLFFFANSRPAVFAPWLAPFSPRVS